MKKVISIHFNHRHRIARLCILMLCGFFFLGITRAFAQTSQRSQATPSASLTKKPSVLKVGATPIPHADLLQYIKPDLEAQGIKLEIIELTDYVTPNILLAEKQIDANFFSIFLISRNFALIANCNLNLLVRYL